jgi:hypothetical protein
VAPPANRSAAQDLDEKRVAFGHDRSLAEHRRKAERGDQAVYGGSTFGARLQTGQGASIREDNVVGDVSIGTNAVLEFGNRIGSRVRIHSGCFLCVPHGLPALPEVQGRRRGAPPGAHRRQQHDLA